MLRRRPIVWAGLAVAAGLVLLVAITQVSSHPRPYAGGGLASNPELDPGSRLSGPAPAFTLTDQFGHRVSLRQFRGRAVILAFNDSECTTVCPLTTAAMLDAKRSLGPAASRVQLLGIDANPQAIAVSDVRAYSQAHEMARQWRFLTGSLAQLKRIWRAYNVAVQIEAGQIDHTPALFVISPRGRLVRVYLTQMSYRSVPQLGQLLAQEVSRLLPSHPEVSSHLSYRAIAPIDPTSDVALPRAGGGSIRLGVAKPRLFVFFATWDSETTDLRTQPLALNGYAASAPRKRLPALLAVDEGSVEPSASALERFLAGLPPPLAYPAAVDRSGRVADGFGVQDEPRLVLTSGSGRVLWTDDVSTSGWPSPAALARRVRAALRNPPPASSAAAARRELAGSPAPLAALHAEAGRLFGNEAGLERRVRALRGYSVVLNAWASWCPPCQKEFPLFAAALVRYGRQVAFLGADTEDSASSARSFLPAPCELSQL
jgi:cytochrome oxidase Cu insertion factor (SCO1/SenC/PrrC family)/thiol-disulfide isomerase/thioredoxin